MVWDQFVVDKREFSETEANPDLESVLCVSGVYNRKCCQCGNRLQFILPQFWRSTPCIISINPRWGCQAM